MRILSFIALLACVFGVEKISAQQIDPISIQFRATNEKNMDSFSFWWSNYRSTTATLSATEMPEVYGTNPYSFKFSKNQISTGDSTKVTVYFAPKQNVEHQNALWFQSSNGETFLVSVQGQGAFSMPYYSSTQNKSHEDLKSALTTLTGQNYKQQGYNGARDEMYADIDNVSGKVECVYTGRTATFNSRTGANNNSFNCEHTWPQSLFSSNEPMKSDIHHLFSTDANANSQRGNLPFGQVSGSGSWNEGGSKKSSSVFEPRDAHKGDCARAMMYFVIRYGDYGNFFAQQEQILRSWHQSFPPTTKSEKRNNDIYGLQKNRNPFVDYPQLVYRFNSFTKTSTEQLENDVYINTSDVNFGIAKPPFGGLTVYKTIVNRSDKTVTLSNFQFSQSEHVVAGLRNGELELAPGEGKQIRILISAMYDNVQTQFQFKTSNAKTPTVSFNISGKIDRSISVNEMVQPEIHLFPNPSNGKFHFASNSEVAIISVFNSQGKQISFLQDQNQLIIDAKNEGIYWVMLRNENAILNRKVVIR
ncbi:MAG: endonuclease [Bacteroidetes bacterium]|nr:endonuclease [Bacteroidota bacterium]